MLVAGIFLGRNLTAFIFPAAACALGIIAALLLKGRSRFAACLAFCFALGACSGSLAFHPVLPAEGEYGIRGIVSGEVTRGSFGQVRTYLSDVTVDGRPLSGGAYWTYYTDEMPPDLLPGRQVSFHASLYHPRGASNPDGYDFREALLQRGVTVGIYGSGGLAVSEPDRFSFYGTAAALRHRLSVSLSASLGEETGAYASAMLLGMRSLIPSEDREAFSRLGIAHILSVSGFHVGVLAGALSLFFHFLKLRPRLRLALYALILFGYAALCGMSQPVIRASLLLLLSQEGRILNRPRSGIHLLSAALFVMALFSPVQVTSASFQLTFCAVLGLIWIAPAASRFRPFRGRIPGMIVESSILTFGVQLGLLLPELRFFQRLPLLVFLINLPAMLVSGVLITLFWIVLLFLPVPGLSSLLSGPLAAVTGFLLSGVRGLAALPGLTLWIHAPTVFTVLGILLLFAGLCSFVRMRRGLRAGLLAAGAAVLVLSLLPLRHSGTEYIQLSAGNADAAVLWDQDSVYVIDTGEDDGTLSSFLRARRLTPDVVILTHLHADHAGGLRSLISDEIPVRTVMLPEGADSQQIHPDFLALLDDLRGAGTEIRYLSRGDVIPLPSGTLAVLWPESGKVRPGQDANRYSLVMRIALKGTVLLQAGDITGVYEPYCAVPADILKVSHHGSPSSSSRDFLEAVSPGAALLSCRSVSRLQDVRARFGDLPVYGTPESGAVTVRFGDGKYTVIPFMTD